MRNQGGDADLGARDNDFVPHAIDFPFNPFLPIYPSFNGVNGFWYRGLGFSYLDCNVVSFIDEAERSSPAL